MGFDLFGVSVGGSSSSSSSSSRSNDSVFLSQLFEQFFGGAVGTAGGIDTSGITSAANDLFGRGGSLLDSLTGIAGGEGSTLTEDIAGLESDLGRFFNEQLLPGITAEAVGGGALGGGRQGVAQGAAAQGVSREFQRGSTALRGADRDRRAGAAEAALGFLPQQLGFAQEAALAPLSPFLSLSQILGGPTVLNQASAESKSKSKSFNFGFGA